MTPALPLTKWEALNLRVAADLAREAALLRALADLTGGAR